MKAKFILLLCVLNLLFMHYYFFSNNYIEDGLLSYIFLVNLLMVIFDVSIILLIWSFVFCNHPKLSLLLTFLTTLLWSFSNVFYVRFFNQYLTLSIMSQIGQLTDQAVLHSMIYGFQWTDSYYIISVSIFVALYYGLKLKPFDRRYRVKLICVPFLSFISVFFVYSVYHLLKSETRNNNSLYKIRTKELFWANARNAYPNTTHFTTGSVRILSLQTWDLFNQLELTDKQRKIIENEYLDLSQRVTNHESPQNVKNVIMVVLESFLSSPISLIVDGKEITPFMNSLIKNDSVYYNGHVAPNITMGESGDGQFIYMTGILPLRDKLTVGEAKNLNLPSLPKMLEKQYNIKYSEIVTPSPPQVWEQEKMNRVYGIKNMFCNKDMLGPSTLYLNDEQLFYMAMHTPAYRNQPFFSMVLSYSTHQPYRTPVDSSFLLHDNSLPESYINYLIACHYTDYWLQKFIDNLKRHGVYDNTLIVIVADHHAHLDALGMGDKIKKELPLFIINGNVDNSRAWRGEMNQLDVFTTILDLLNIKSRWHGLGHTILNPHYQNSLSESVWGFSEQIIKGCYFEK